MEHAVDRNTAARIDHLTAELQTRFVAEDWKQILGERRVMAPLVGSD